MYLIPKAMLIVYSLRSYTVFDSVYIGHGKPFITTMQQGLLWFREKLQKVRVIADSW